MTELDERRARIEDLRAQQRRSERRRSAIFFGVLLVGSLVAFGRPAFGWVENKIDDPMRRPIEAFGSPIAQAGCGKITKDPAGPAQMHVKVGTRVAYAVVPPSHGAHYENPVPFSARPFFTTRDSPPIENLVHNLEHGYTILWYDPTVSGKTQDEIQVLTERLRHEAKYQQFIATPWDSTYGGFPAGKTVALSHWSGPNKKGQSYGHRLLCEQLSGAAVQEFMDRYPATDAPERNLR
ncbi:MAG: DUF3105 domain-containing protein [Sporichthyaceae bacterium]